MVHLVLHQLLYPTYLKCSPVYKLCLVCPVIMANTLLLRRKENYSVTNLQDVLDDAYKLLQEPIASSLPYSSCASALVFLQDKFLKTSVKDPCFSPFNNLVKTCSRVLQLLTLKIQLPLEHLHSSSFMNCSNYSGDIWEKRLALLVLHGVSIKRETSYSSYFDDKSLAISDGPHLIQLIKVLRISDVLPTHKSPIHPKTELSFLQLFSPAADPCFVYQSILILGLLYQQLTQPKVHEKIVLEDIQETNSSPSFTNALLPFMQWIISLSNQLKLNDWGVTSEDSLDPAMVPIVSMLSALWTSLSFTKTLPALNTAPTLVNNLKFTQRALNTFIALQGPTEKLVQRELLILQVSILRCCLRLGETDAKHDKLVSYFITHTFKTVASQCYENTPDYYLKNTLYRFVYFNAWNALIILFFRLPFSQFVIHFTLGVLSLPKPKHDAIVWVFVLQQLIHLTAMLCTLCKGSMRDHCSKLFVGITFDSLLNTAADKEFYPIHSRYQQNIKYVGKKFCEEILQTSFTKYFTPHLFTVPESDSPCQFSPTVPLCVQSSFTELFCSYIRLKLLVENENFSQVLDQLSIDRIPMILLAHLSVQNLCYDYSLIDIFFKKLFGCEAVKDSDCNDFALSLCYCSAHHQRLFVKDIFHEASTTQDKRDRAQKILQFFFFHSRFKFQPLYSISKHDECAPALPVKSIEQTWTTKLLACHTLPVMSSRELFVTEFGILYLSQIMQPPNPFQPIVIPSRECLMSKEMHVCERIISTWTIPSTVIFPVPSCFMPTLYTVLNRLNFPQNHQNNSCTKLLPNITTPITTIHFEGYLDLLYLFPKETHTFVSSDVLHSCLKKRYKSLVSRCLFNTYFSACGDLEMPSQICSSTAPVNTPVNFLRYSFLVHMGRQILSELFDTESNKETILHFLTNTFLHSHSTQ
ncbi:uncharacterized protein LOC128883027 [Hylaeus volcanicus]|uniref:uncharacterized protein LOC128883027 n=1 Tax=Hylaeus volcanicus TaxID=313075 RepID=UPI0023B8404B|nr:uncharacterized protein LOC128883027 [Hylaeus volcanicus]